MYYLPVFENWMELSEKYVFRGSKKILILAWWSITAHRKFTMMIKSFSKIRLLGTWIPSSGKLQHFAITRWSQISSNHAIKWNHPNVGQSKTNHLKTKTGTFWIQSLRNVIIALYLVVRLSKQYLAFRVEVQPDSFNGLIWATIDSLSDKI